MKTVIVCLTALLVAAIAAPQQQQGIVRPGVIPVLQRTEIRDEAGQFSLRYVSGDGTSFTEQGVLKPRKDGKDNVLVKQGSVSYTAPDGKPITLNYTADEEGFRAQGSHLPVAPVVPAPTF